MFAAIFEGAVYAGVCLGIKTIALTTLAIVLIKISSQIHKSIQHLQTDVHSLSIEMGRVLDSMNGFIRTDLHGVSEETTHLISKLNDLSTDINDKSHSLNFLFKPFHFLNEKLGKDSSQGESPPQSSTIPQAIKWVGSSVLLIKTIKELLKKYGKQK